MKVLHFISKEERDSWNTKGLPLGPNDVTRQNFEPVREKNGLKRYGVLIAENDEGKLTGLEQSALHNPFNKDDYTRE